LKIFANFDMDNTLVSTEDLITLALAELGYMVKPPQTQFDFNWIEGYAPPPDFQWDVFFYRLFTERYKELRPIDDEVHRFLQMVYGDGSEPVRVVTARPAGSLMHYCCMKTLEQCFPDIEFSINVVGSGASKMRYTFGADIFFEDRRKTAIQLSEHGQIVFLKDYTYNQIDHSVHIFEKDPLLLMVPGTIVRFDDYEQVIESDVIKFIRPMWNK